MAQSCANLLEQDKQIIAPLYGKADINFVKGDVVDEPGEDDPMLVQQELKLDNNARQDYHVFDQNGVHMGVLTAYGFDAAKEILKTSNEVKNSGVYYLRSRTTGQMQSVRVTR